MPKTVIIAEIGVNHNGDIRLAKKIIKKCSKIGIDYVKFQTFKTDNCIHPNAIKAKYQTKNDIKSKTQYELVKKLELNFDEFKILKKYCDKCNVGFLSTAFDIESQIFLKDLGVKICKIPSGEINNFHLINSASKLFKEFIISTGMANVEEIENIIEFLIKSGIKKKNITILHCNTDYPTRLEDVNINAMIDIKNIFNCSVGYSDHTKGIEASLAAVSLGARIIEKHITLNNDLEGPDHEMSLNIKKFKFLVSSIRRLEKVFVGSGKKTPSKSELKNLKAVRRGVYLNGNYQKGTILKEENLIYLRPENNVSVKDSDKIIGKELLFDKKHLDSINLNELK